MEEKSQSLIGFCPRKVNWKIVHCRLWFRFRFRRISTNVLTDVELLNCGIWRSLHGVSTDTKNDRKEMTLKKGTCPSAHSLPAQQVRQQRADQVALHLEFAFNGRSGCLAPDVWILGQTLPCTLWLPLVWTSLNICNFFWHWTELDDRPTDIPHICHFFTQPQFQHWTFTLESA